MVAFLEPLDLEGLFIGAFAGSVSIFIFVTALIIAGLAGRFRMPSIIFLAFLSLFGVVVAGLYQGLYALVVVIGGILIFYSMGRIIKT